MKKRRHCAHCGTSWLLLLKFFFYVCLESRRTIPPSNQTTKHQPSTKPSLDNNVEISTDANQMIKHFDRLIDCTLSHPSPLYVTGRRKASHLSSFHHFTSLSPLTVPGRVTNMDFTHPVSATRHLMGKILREKRFSFSNNSVPVWLLVVEEILGVVKF